MKMKQNENYEMQAEMLENPLEGKGIVALEENLDRKTRAMGYNRTSKRFPQ